MNSPPISPLNEYVSILIIYLYYTRVNSQCAISLPRTTFSRHFGTMFRFLATSCVSSFNLWRISTQRMYTPIPMTCFIFLTLGLLLRRGFIRKLNIIQASVMFLFPPLKGGFWPFHYAVQFPPPPSLSPLARVPISLLSDVALPMAHHVFLRELFGMINSNVI